jgi:AraC-like DNA-binding protein
MPQNDRRRSKNVSIEFEPIQNLTELPYTDRITLVLVTDGKASLLLNNNFITITAPCILCISQHDQMQVIENNLLFAQSFSLSPNLLTSYFTSKPIKESTADMAEWNYTSNMLRLFFTRNETYNGLLVLPPHVYLKIFEWISIIGTETNAQSDGRWICRIRRYFIQVLNLLDDIYENREKTDDINEFFSPVDAVIEYIHVHYMNVITLDMLCNLTHMNRTSLNKIYKERTGKTVIDYLICYRLRIARELLNYTSLTLDEIAHSTGFVYDTYLIRQFTVKMGETPTEYRKNYRNKLDTNTSPQI